MERLAHGCVRLNLLPLLLNHRQSRIVPTISKQAAFAPRCRLSQLLLLLLVLPHLLLHLAVMVGAAELDQLGNVVPRLRSLLGL